MSVEAVAEWFLAYQYVVIFLFVFFEGTIAMVVGGFLVRLDYAGFWPMYAVLMAGDLTADICWYYVGAHGAARLVRRYGRFFSVTDELLAKSVAAFRRHDVKILLTSKLTMGLGFAIVILMAAGVARVPFKKYLLFNAVGQIVWTALLMGVGYAFGNLYLFVDKGLRGLTLFAGTVILIAATYGFTRYLQTKDLQNRL